MARPVYLYLIAENIPQPLLRCWLLQGLSLELGIHHKVEMKVGKIHEISNYTP
jgi:hypothetical protein